MPSVTFTAPDLLEINHGEIATFQDMFDADNADYYVLKSDTISGDTNYVLGENDPSPGQSSFGWVRPKDNNDVPLLVSVSTYTSGDIQFIINGKDHWHNKVSETLYISTKGDFQGQIKFAVIDSIEIAKVGGKFGFELRQPCWGLVWRQRNPQPFDRVKYTWYSPNQTFFMGHHTSASDPDYNYRDDGLSTLTITGTLQDAQYDGDAVSWYVGCDVVVAEGGLLELGNDQDRVGVHISSIFNYNLTGNDFFGIYGSMNLYGVHWVGYHPMIHSSGSRVINLLDCYFDGYGGPIVNTDASSDCLGYIERNTFRSEYAVALQLTRNPLTFIGNKFVESVYGCQVPSISGETLEITMTNPVFAGNVYDVILNVPPNVGNHLYLTLIDAQRGDGSFMAASNHPTIAGIAARCFLYVKFSLNLNVHDEAGTGINGATVSWVDTTNGSQTGTATTNSSGDIPVQYLLEGFNQAASGYPYTNYPTYKFTISKAGYLTRTFMMDITGAIRGNKTLYKQKVLNMSKFARFEQP